MDRDGAEGHADLSLVGVSEPDQDQAESELAIRLRALEEQNAALWNRLRELDPSAKEDDGGEGRRGTLIVVASAKGGVGKSVIAANLAAGLVQFHNQRTAIVDANLEFGDQAVLFNIRTDKTLAHLAGLSSVDERVASDLLTPHASGLSIVASPPDPVFAEQISPTAISDLVQAYQTDFAYVVVDTRAGFGELNLQLLEAADRILLVATPEMNTAAHTGHFLELARRLGHAEKIQLILNRSNTGLKSEVVADFLNVPVASSIVSGGEAFIRATNTGESLFSRDPEGRERVTRDLRSLVAMTVGKPELSPIAGTAEKVKPADPPARSWTRLLRRDGHGAAQLAGGGLGAAGITALVVAVVMGTQSGDRSIAPIAIAGSAEEAALQTRTAETLHSTVASVPSVSVFPTDPAPVDLSAPLLGPIEPPPAANRPAEDISVPAAIPEAREPREFEEGIGQVQTASSVINGEIAVSPIAEPPTPASQPESDGSPPVTGFPTATLYLPGLEAVSLHRTPSLAAPMLALLPVGTHVTVLARTASANGEQWQEVQTDGGEIGWVIWRTVQLS